MAGILKMLADAEEGLARVVASTAAAVASVKGDAATVAAAIDMIEADASKVDDAIDRITQKIQVGANNWSQEIQLGLDLVEVGGLRIDEFLTKYGDWVVQTTEGAETIRQSLEGLDLRGKEQEIQELIVAISRGSEGVTKALEFLATAQGKYADELRKTVEQVQRGQVPLEKLEALVRQIKAQFGGTAYADLAEALADAARTGALP